MWRSKLITERSGKDFDNPIGPFIVSIGLACALILNFAFKYNAAIGKHTGNTEVIIRQLQDHNISDGLYVQTT
jgi:hypothetical protein